MKYIFAFLLFSPMVNAAPVDVCSGGGSAKHFLSQWSEDGDSIDTLSRVDGAKFSVAEGKVVYNDDLNGDGAKDFIFVSYDSEGSSKDRTYSFLIQCRGYLRYVGGDYFAKIEVLESAPQNKSSYKDIKVYSYQRDAQGNVSYNGKEALMTPHIWSFNPETKKYEGKSE